MYWSNEDNAFVVQVPELPSCMAHGSTQSDALNNINDVMKLWIDVALEHGDPIPEPMGHRLMKKMGADNKFSL
ncbi:MAG TPA: type II toxin-antitoxin system HicB family antitoxin [Candidatus Deferrimicrobium sp.]|nr:type II toxin-antitoxin system HicB family antitoxin [Candidatus Deferrimicrobium sp.]